MNAVSNQLLPEHALEAYTASMGQTFGQYLREKRVAAGLSLRQAAAALGISHVYLGEVERGVRGPLGPDRWPAISAAIPGATIAELSRAALTSRPVSINVTGSGHQVQELTLLLQRKVEEGSMEDAMTARLLAILREGRKPDE